MSQLTSRAEQAIGSVYASLLAVFWYLAAGQVAQSAATLGILETSARWRAAAAAAPWLALIPLALAGLILSPLWPRLRALGVRLFERLRRARAFSLTAALLAWAAFFALVFALGKYDRLLNQAWMRAFAGLLLGGTSGALLCAFWPQKQRLALWLVGLLLPPALYELLHVLPMISTYPFSLEWSEGTWYYYASTLFGRRLYGLDLPLPYSHLTRSLLQAIPFIIPGLPLVVHRAWQALLWAGLPLLAAGFLVRRLRLPAPEWRAAAFLGGFLFINLGPVLYHLLPPVILLLALFDPRRPLRTLLVTALATAWGALSRINWIPVPGMLALVLYLLETPRSAFPTLRAYLRLPLLLGGAALITAAGVFAVYTAQPGSNPLTSLSSPLLWYRLWPNPNLSGGLVLNILLVSLPFAAAAGGSWRGLGGLRAGLMLLMTLVLLAGGTLVSLKIGGGNNLHNYDAYLTLLLIWGAYALSAALRAETQRPALRADLRGWLCAAAALIVLLSALQPGISVKPRSTAQANLDLLTLNGQIERVLQNGGRVLFISQRHLLTFGLTPRTPLESKYELNELMEMAMAGNRAYLDEFHAEIASLTYDLIIVDRLKIYRLPLTSRFAEENNAWVKEVAAPLNRYYRPAFSLPESGLDLLIPK